MRLDLLPFLRCPVTGAPLRLKHAITIDAHVVSGWLVSPRHSYPIVDYVPRFVAPNNYADNFGIQWNSFRRTQLDSATGVPISQNRFYQFSGWKPEELAGKVVLDVGCGAGRFTEIALQAGATVIAFDYSSAVDACWANHRLHPRLCVVQADVYHPPFARDAFDFVYCFGVLQHTPDPRAAFLALPPLLRPDGGRIAVDVYPRLLVNALWPKYWVRPVTRRLAPDMLFRMIQRSAPSLLRVSRAFSRVPLLGGKLRYAVPVANYEGLLPLSPQQLLEWATLDTFDMLAPAHDHPQHASALRSWFRDADLQDVCIQRPGFLVGRGRRGPAGSVSV
jgi:SAM-dependent methyltransferase